MTVRDARPVRRAVDARICREVTAVLELATAGSRKLDVLVACALGEADIGSATVLRELLEADALPRHADLVGAGDCPPFTTSLDAALPNEHVILSVFAPALGHWSAVQRTVDGRETVGHGATEALARRIAALKSLAGSARMAGAEPDARARPAADIAMQHGAPARTAAANDMAADAGEEPDPAEIRRILRTLDHDAGGAPRQGDDEDGSPPEADGPPGERDWQIRF